MNNICKEKLLDMEGLLTVNINETVEFMMWFILSQILQTLSA